MHKQEVTQQITQLLFTLASQLNIPYPQNIQHPQFACNCLNKIMNSLTEQWKPIHQEEAQNEEQLWTNIIYIIQDNILQEEILPQGQELTFKQIVKVYYILNQLLNNIPEQSKQQSKAHTQVKEQKKANNEGKSIEKKKEKVNKSKPKKENMKNSQNMKSTKSKKVNQTHQNYNKTVYHQKQEKKSINTNRNKSVKMQHKSNHTVKVEKKQDIMRKHSKSTVDVDYLKFIELRHKKINSQIRDKQLEYYLSLKDQKVAYIQHIHKLMEKLQKQKYEEMQKDKVKGNIEQNKEFEERIERIDSLFNRNMVKLKKNIRERKQINKLNDVKEMNLCRAMQSSIHKKKQKEMENLKNIYSVQNNKLKSIIGDEQILKQKFLNLHHKYCQ